MKSILLSIKPKWVAKILNGEKTIEIRKTMPKCDLPITVYIYCTKQKILGNLIKVGSQEISDLVGKNTITGINKGFMKEGDIDLQGKVVAKFTVRKVEHFEFDTCSRDICGYWLDSGQVFNIKKTCLTSEEMSAYIGGKDGYAYHIEDLVIFDKPKELSEFYKVGAWKVFEEQFNSSYIRRSTQEIMQSLGQILTKAPQNFCYVESEE